MVFNKPDGTQTYDFPRIMRKTAMGSKLPTLTRFTSTCLRYRAPVLWGLILSQEIQWYRPNPRPSQMCDVG